MDEITFTPDRSAYIRAHAWMAAFAMAAGMGVLWAAGNPHIWTGAIGGLAAISFRGWYLASEELAVVWTISGGVLSGPAERRVPLSDIETLRSMGGYVQVITKGGDKHLIKYQADPASTLSAIERARA
ncbi:hypothetical protein PXK00_14100 [Phaeobacter sp. QD34_3]|uniref:hypothetical protein n=1 Tax=unclassified Phaeobacter TaxID=2621772 RepID=UPI00237FBBBF|nr:MULTISPECIES: hypothetical protein [unclassified Phaeobacter]MDE4134250.1 hypothetical protein [Phaeobacter sp. QD34_3]MDE4137992.1 hypothetical protein [Phaeobacter sp. QD34_24]